MKALLRRHQYNLLSTLGAVLLLWVGPYLFWRLRASFSPYLGATVILVPSRLPQSVDPLFLPLVRIDQWISGETILVTRYPETPPLHFPAGNPPANE